MLRPWMNLDEPGTNSLRGDFCAGRDVFQETIFVPF